MDFTVKIHNNTVYLVGQGRNGDFLFKKFTTFHIWPWTKIESKIHSIRKNWEYHHEIVQRRNN